MTSLLFTISSTGDITISIAFIILAGLVIARIASLPHALLVIVMGSLSVFLLNQGAMLAGIILLILMASYIAFTLIQYGDELTIQVTKKFNELKRQTNKGNALTKNNGANFQQREIILAAFDELKKSGAGALVVIKHQDDIYALIKGGTEINASLSAALLVSIFNKAAPLHDGAVVIDGIILTKAGAVLPLSNSDSHNGTRHRAGYGISEQSDCTVYILSEESGTITCVRNGTIVRESGLAD